jgi:hypothetical protein
MRNALHSRLAATVSYYDGQFFALRPPVTPLVGLSINATSPLLHMFSIRDDVQERANYARFGVRLTRGGDVDFAREWGRRCRQCWDCR